MLILLFAAGALIWVRSLDDMSHQDRNIQTAKVSFISLALLSIWLMAFSQFGSASAIRCVRWDDGIDCSVSSALKDRGVWEISLRSWNGAGSSPSARYCSVEQPSKSSPANKRFIPSAKDYPQFLAPGQNTTVHGQLLARDWKTQPPEKLRRQAIGTAWSGFAVAGNLAVTQERGESEVVTAYELASGRLVWSHADAAHYNTTIAGEGPRATPTIDDNRVYTLAIKREF